MPTDAPSPADQLADLLDGRLGIDEVSPEVARLGELAGQVRTHVTLVPPTEAFRAALRDQLVQTAAAPTAAATAAATSTSTVATGGSGLSAIVAGITATAVLATGTLTAADRAGPGDVLVGLDRGVERAQLALSGDERDVELLVDFATERVLEALGLVDTAAVGAALGDAQDLLDQALALAAAQGRAVEDLLDPYTGALLTLASRTDDPAVRALVEQRLGALGIDLPRTGRDGSPLVPPAGDAPPEGDGSPGGGGPVGDEEVGPTDEDGEAPTDDGLDGTLEDLEEDVEDLTDDLTDPVDDLTDPVDDVTDPLDDVTDPVEDAVDDAVDDAAEVLEDAVGG